MIYILTCTIVFKEQGAVHRQKRSITTSIKLKDPMRQIIFKFENSHKSVFQMYQHNQSYLNSSTCQFCSELFGMVQHLSIVHSQPKVLGTLLILFRLMPVSYPEMLPKFEQSRFERSSQKRNYGNYMAQTRRMRGKVSQRELLVYTFQDRSSCYSINEINTSTMYNYNVEIKPVLKRAFIMLYLLYKSISKES